MLFKKGLSIVFALLLTAIFIAGCDNNQTEKGRVKLLDDVLDKRGAGNAFITKANAKKMKHAFDVWHRHRQFYDNNGTFISGSPRQDTNDDSDIDVNQPGINDSLSKAVWIDKDVLAYLADLVENDPSGCDGVRIYFGSYEKITAPGQKKDKQATIFMVPTNPAHANPKHHKDNYNIVEQFYNKLNDSLKNKWFDGALNHGELCPQDCNDNN